jgi:DNA-nicking Smr family endonuclease
MAKKKNTAKPSKRDFNNSPFSDLKGFAVSAQETGDANSSQSQAHDSPLEPHGSFAEEMDMLGVRRLDADAEDAEQILAGGSAEVEEDTSSPDDGELFLQAMGELQVNFSDRLPEEEQPSTASARRMKQLRQGKLTPEAALDLHGLKRREVAARLRFFLQDASHHGWQTLLVITCKGLHSADGEPVLRIEAEHFLAGEGRKWVAEWGRAPKQLGGDGALVLFLRKQPQ